ncbi:MAG: DUF4199 domain-containing protein [Kordia sp.]|uniref:DUF4199 domain-containing protein n=1 Tax=Kordia sp. TaxID=1965332 RepID=UPI00385A1B1D
MFSKTSHFGIALGFVLITSFVLQYKLNVHTDPKNVYSLAMFPVMAVFMIVAIIKVSRKEEPFSIREGLKTGIGVILLGSLMLWIYMIVHASYIETDFVDKLAVVAKNDLKENSDFTDEKIQESIKFLKSNYKFSIFIENVFKSLLSGFFFSLLASLAIKSKIFTNPKNPV